MDVDCTLQLQVSALHRSNKLISDLTALSITFRWHMLSMMLNRAQALVQGFSLPCVHIS